MQVRRHRPSRDGRALLRPQAAIPREVRQLRAKNGMAQAVRRGFERMEEPMTDEERIRDAEAYLRWVGELEKSVEAVKLAREHAADIVRGVDYTKAGGTAKSPDAIPSAVIRLEALDERLAERIRSYLEAFGEAMDLLASMEDATLRDILTMRYIGKASWEQVCVARNYSYSRMMELRKKALLAFWDVLNR